MKKFDLTALLINVVFAELVGAVSALLSGGFRELYTSAVQPPLAPPPVVFPIVWAILYALMGISAYLIFSESSSPERSVSIGLYAAQLFVNFLWSIIFFRFEAFGLAAFTAVLLAALVAAMILSFRKVNKLAAILNFPYLAWSIFAVYLAFGVRILNR